MSGTPHTADILDYDGSVIVTLTGFTQKCDEYCTASTCAVQAGRVAAMSIPPGKP